MALFNVCRYRLLGTVDATYLVNYWVYVKWNDSTELLEVHLYDSTNVFSSIEASGPDLTVEDYTLYDYEYEFCDVADLIYFSPDPTFFPYATQLSEVGSAVCTVGHVCDVAITSVVVTQPTDHAATDGQVVITSTSTGTMMYSLQAFSAVNSGQASNTFTGLADGAFTAYVQDSFGCITSMNFSLYAEDSFGVRWRSEFDTRLEELTGYSYRIDILQRDYAGAVEEVKAGVIPITIDYQGETENKYKQIIASMATISLIAETNYYFEDLFLGDEREFLVKFYIDDGGGNDLEWTGYVIQEGHEEAYKAAPYEVTIMATDGLGDLAKYQYNEGDVIRGDQSLMAIIARCLVDTDLHLNVRSAISRFEITHNVTASDDPLPQTFFNSYFLNDKTKQEVLEEILKTFGARIYQSVGVWFIVSIENSCETSLAYREFDSDGIYVSNSTIATNLDLAFPDTANRICFKDNNAILRVRTGYKEVIINHNLILVNNLFYEGRFEVDDFNDFTYLFAGWSLNLLGAAGSNYGRLNRSEDNSDAAFYVDLLNAVVPATVILSTEEKVWEYIGGTDSIKFSFKYFIFKLLPSPYIRFRYAVIGGGTNYLQPNGSWDTAPSTSTIYVTSFNKWESIEIISPPNLLDLAAVLTPIKIVLYLDGNNAYDASSLATFQSSIATAGDAMATGDRRAALDTLVSAGDIVRYYTLHKGTDATSSPSILRPSDYNGTTNPVVWKLDETWDTPLDGSGNLANLVQAYAIDDVKIEFLPDNATPLDTVEYQQTISVRNKNSFETDVFFGDLPDYYNAIHLYKNYLMLSDGSQTTLWARQGVTEELSILDMLKLDYSAQFPNGLLVLNATLTGDKIMRYYNCLIEKNDGDKPYMNMGLKIDYLNNEYIWEGVELLTSVTGPPPDTSGFTVGFSLGYRA